MNIVFFGTSAFAAESLQSIIKSRHKVLAVVTQPDRARGRNLKISPPPVKVASSTAGLKIYQPQDASSPESAGFLKSLGADLFVVISFGHILKKEVLDIPKLYSINLHASLLPKYRGAAPVNWAIINGEKRTGITVIRMNEKMDEGDMLLSRAVDIDDEDTGITLSEKLAELGSAVLMEAIELIAVNKDVKMIKQDSANATYAPKLKKEDGLINWSTDALDINNRVRGLVPWPGAYTHYLNNTLKVLRTQVLPDENSGSGEYGKVMEVSKDKGIVVKARNGLVAIQYLQLEGKKPMASSAFIRGHRVREGYVFE